MSYAYRQDLNWLVTDFTARVADVAHAAVVSADGVPLAMSEHIPAGFAGQLAAITSGLTSLMQGAARLFEAGQPTQALVEMEGGLMFVMAISDGSSLAVLAAPECDTDLVSYEMTLLVEAVGDVLTPAARGPQGLLPAAPLAVAPPPGLGRDLGQLGGRQGRGFPVRQRDPVGAGQPLQEQRPVVGLREVAAVGDGAVVAQDHGAAAGQRADGRLGQAG